MNAPPMIGPKTAIRSRWWPPTLWIAAASGTAHATAPTAARAARARLRLGAGADRATDEPSRAVRPRTIRPWSGGGSSLLVATGMLLAPGARADARAMRPEGTPLRIVVLPVQQRGERLPPRRGVARTFRRARAWYRRESRGRIDLRYTIAPPIDEATAQGGEDGPAVIAMRRAAERGVDVAGAVPVLIEATRRPSRSYGSPPLIQIRGSRGATPTGRPRARPCARTRPRPRPDRVRAAVRPVPLHAAPAPGPRVRRRARRDGRRRRALRRLSAGRAGPRRAPGCARPAVPSRRSGRSRRGGRRCCACAPRPGTTSSTPAGATASGPRRVASRAPRGAAIERVRRALALPAGPAPPAADARARDGPAARSATRARRPASPGRSSAPAGASRCPGRFRLRVLRGGGPLRVATTWLDRSPPSLARDRRADRAAGGAAPVLALSLRAAATGAGIARVEVEQGGTVTRGRSRHRPGARRGRARTGHDPGGARRGARRARPRGRRGGQRLAVGRGRTSPPSRPGPARPSAGTRGSDRSRPPRRCSPPVRS